MQCPNCQKEAINVNGKYVCLDCGIEVSSTQPAATPAPDPNGPTVVNHAVNLTAAPEEDEPAPAVVAPVEEPAAPAEVKRPVEDLFVESLNTAAEPGSFDFGQSVQPSFGAPAQSSPGDFAMNTSSTPAEPAAAPVVADEAVSVAPKPVETTETVSPVADLMPNLKEENTDLSMDSSFLSGGEKEAPETFFNPASIDIKSVTETVPQADTETTLTPVAEPAPEEPTSTPVTEPVSQVPDFPGIPAAPAENTAENLAVPDFPGMQTAPAETPTAEPVSETTNEVVATAAVEDSLLQEPVQEVAETPAPIEEPVAPAPEPATVMPVEGMPEAPVEAAPAAPTWTPAELEKDMSEEAEAVTEVPEPKTPAWSSEEPSLNTESEVSPQNSSFDAFSTPSTPPTEPTLSDIEETGKNEKEETDGFFPKTEETSEGFSNEPAPGESAVPGGGNLDELLNKYGPEAPAGAASYQTPAFDTVQPAATSAPFAFQANTKNEPIPTVESVFGENGNVPKQEFVGKKSNKKILIIALAVIGVLVVSGAAFAIVASLNKPKQSQTGMSQEEMFRISNSISKEMDAPRNVKVEYQTSYVFSNLSEVEADLKTKLEKPVEDKGSWAADKDDNLKLEGTLGGVDQKVIFISDKNKTYQYKGGAWAATDGYQAPKSPVFFNYENKGGLFYLTKADKLENMGAEQIEESSYTKIKISPKEDLVKEAILTSTPTLASAEITKVDATALEVYAWVGSDYLIKKVEVGGTVAVESTLFKGDVAISGSADYTYGYLEIAAPIASAAGAAPIVRADITPIETSPKKVEVVDEKG